LANKEKFTSWVCQKKKKSRKKKKGGRPKIFQKNVLANEGIRTGWGRVSESKCIQEGGTEKRRDLLHLGHSAIIARLLGGRKRWKETRKKPDISQKEKNEVKGGVNFHRKSIRQKTTSEGTLQSGKRNTENCERGKNL